MLAEKPANINRCVLCKQCVFVKVTHDFIHSHFLYWPMSGAFKQDLSKWVKMNKVGM